MELAGLLENFIDRTRGIVRDALFFRVRHTFAVFRSHYPDSELDALSEGYALTPPEVIEEGIDAAVVPGYVLVE